MCHVKPSVNMASLLFVCQKSRNYGGPAFKSEKLRRKGLATGGAIAEWHLRGSRDRVTFTYDTSGLAREWKYNGAQVLSTAKSVTECGNTPVSWPSGSGSSTLTAIPQAHGAIMVALPPRWVKVRPTGRHRQTL
jgi:hypothetical protein